MHPNDLPGSPVDPAFDALDRIYLEKLRLATDVIMRLGEDDAIPAPLESELSLLRDRIDRALLSQPG